MLKLKRGKITIYLAGGLLGAIAVALTTGATSVPASNSSSLAYSSLLAKVPATTPQPVQQIGKTVQDLAPLFSGGSDSIVAKTVGHAEGTRGADGGKNRAYYGHSDPGNGVWNQGTFSYQHGAASPEEADVKQLNRLKGQASKLIQLAKQYKIYPLTIEETLNGIDLANQAPAAALDPSEGYIVRLAEARKKNISPAEKVLFARTWSYFGDGRWQAGGLCLYGCNTEASVRYDQKRRQDAIARVASSLGLYKPTSSGLAVDWFAESYLKIRDKL